MIYLIWATVLIGVLALYFRQVYSRLSKYGVKHFKPIPPLGNMCPVLLRTAHVTDNISALYNSFPGERFVGSYEFLKPMLIVKDIELIKKIAVKDFEHFLDHRTFVDETTDPFFGRNLFSLKGQEWKDMRSTLSPAFTSSKIRLMVPFMVEVSNQMTKSLKADIQDSGVNFIDVDCKDLTTRYANDVIASCAFGLKVDSHNEKNNEFYQTGKDTANRFKVSLFTNATKKFFRNLVLDMMDKREAKKIIRPDMIHLLMEAKKGKLAHDDKESKDPDAGFATVEESAVGKKEIDRVWTDEDLIAQVLLFFFAGFETVSTGMAFALHEIALNTDVQERMVQEIKENESKTNGHFSYAAVQNLTYMDMVVSEVLRKWTPVVTLNRICVKDYNIGRPNNESTSDYIIRKGENIDIPAFAIHRDPEFYPNPQKFDPERFSETNKHSIKPFTYMPFGLGPRNCIGSRFALCEIKVMLYQLLLHMKISPCEKTSLSEKLDRSSANFRLEGGHWLRFQLRQ